MTVTTTARVDATLALIDHAIGDWTVSDDAARWRPPEPDFDCPELPRLSHYPTADIYHAMHTQGLDGWAARAFTIGNARSFRPIDIPGVAEAIEQARAVLRQLLGEQISATVHALTPLAEALGIDADVLDADVLTATVDQATARRRALDARRNRNTGPPSPYRLDGRRRRILKL